MATDLPARLSPEQLAKIQRDNGNACDDTVTVLLAEIDALRLELAVIDGLPQWRSPTGEAMSDISMQIGAIRRVRAATHEHTQKCEYWGQRDFRHDCTCNHLERVGVDWDEQIAAAFLATEKAIFRPQDWDRQIAFLAALAGVPPQEKP